MKKYYILFFALINSFSVSAQIQWQKSLGGTDFEIGHSIIQTYDSGYVVLGTSQSNNGDVTGNNGYRDYWVVKLNESGTIEWQESLGGTGTEEASSIIQTSDSGYILAGSSESNDGDVTGNHGSGDFWVVKLNSSGVIQWQKSLGGTGNEWASSIVQTSDSGYIVAGLSESNDGDVTVNHGYEDYWVAKLNLSGTIEWQKSLGGSGDDEAYSIIQTFDSGFVVAGFSGSNDGDVTGNHGGSDFWIVKLDTAGTIVWEKSLGGGQHDEANSIIQTYDKGYAIAGYSHSNNGDVTSNNGVSDFWIVKLAQTTGIENLSNSNGLNVYPNPSTDNFSIRSNSEFDNAQLKIFNAMGCNVYSSRLNMETKVIDAENFSSGIYYLQIIKGEKMWGEKIIKE